MRNSVLLKLMIVISLFSCKDKSGAEVKYFSDGDTSKIAYYDNGELNGPYKEFYNNGNLKVHRKYKNGLLNGIQKVFYENESLKYYSYLENDTILYYKKFSESGEPLEGKMGLKSPDDMYKKRLCINDSLNIGYSLVHSYLKRPYIAMDLMALNGNKRDTIIEMNSDTTIIYYSFKPKRIGRYDIEANVYEISAINDVIYGHYVDTLSFVVHNDCN